MGQRLRGRERHTTYDVLDVTVPRVNALDVLPVRPQSKNWLYCDISLWTGVFLKTSG